MVDERGRATGEAEGADRRDFAGGRVATVRLFTATERVGACTGISGSVRTLLRTSENCA